MGENGNCSPAERKFRPLLFQKGRNWEKLPRWAEFYSRLGQFSVEVMPRDGRLVIALAVPTRSFVAAFSALGVIQAAFPEESQSNPDHFDDLCRLPKATPLFFRDKGSIKRVFVDRTVEYRDQVFLKVLVLGKRKGHEAAHLLLPKSSADLLERVADDNTKPTKRTVGKEISNQHEFLFGYSGEQNAMRFLMSPKLDCTIVGIQSVLRRELCDYEFGYTSDKGVSKGFLNDILLVKKFSKMPEIHHSEVVRPLAGTKLPDVPIAPVVIFDGANGFLDHRNNFRSKCWIVVLDKTEPNFDGATQAINQEIPRAVAPVKIDSIRDSIPSGVELCAFEVRHDAN